MSSERLIYTMKIIWMHTLLIRIAFWRRLQANISTRVSNMLVLNNFYVDLPFLSAIVIWIQSHRIVVLSMDTRFSDLNVFLEVFVFDHDKSSWWILRRIINRMLDLLVDSDILNHRGRRLQYLVVQRDNTAYHESWTYTSRSLCFSFLLF